MYLLVATVATLTLRCGAWTTPDSTPDLRSNAMINPTFGVTPNVMIPVTQEVTLIETPDATPGLKIYTTPKAKPSAMPSSPKPDLTSDATTYYTFATNPNLGEDFSTTDLPDLQKGSEETTYNTYATNPEYTTDPPTPEMVVLPARPNVPDFGVGNPISSNNDILEQPSTKKTTEAVTEEITVDNKEVTVGNKGVTVENKEATVENDDTNVGNKDVTEAPTYGSTEGIKDITEGNKGATGSSEGKQDSPTPTDGNQKDDPTTPPPQESSASHFCFSVVVVVMSALLSVFCSL